MVESLFYFSGLTIVLLWGLAWLGVRRRFDSFMRRHVSAQEVVADYEVIFFYIMRESMWSLLKLGLAALACYTVDTLTGICQQVPVVIVYTLTRMLDVA